MIQKKKRDPSVFSSVESSPRSGQYGVGTEVRSAEHARDGFREPPEMEAWRVHRGGGGGKGCHGEGTRRTCDSDP